uniref:Uncharacterized protein n=1 Tax=Romanomermis culicivorax TaxID=13658 RepID=A0A915KLK6_ROMCU
MLPNIKLAIRQSQAPLIFQPIRNLILLNTGKERVNAAPLYTSLLVKFLLDSNTEVCIVKSDFAKFLSKIEPNNDQERREQGTNLKPGSYFCSASKFTPIFPKKYGMTDVFALADN